VPPALLDQTAEALSEIHINVDLPNRRDRQSRHVPCQIQRPAKSLVLFMKELCGGNGFKVAEAKKFLGGENDCNFRPSHTRAMRTGRGPIPDSSFPPKGACSSPPSPIC